MTAALLAEVERIRPILEESAVQAEAERALPDAAYDATLAAGLFRMLTPKAFGGLELHPVEAFRVIEAVARIDSAAGWCLNISQVIGAFACWLPEKHHAGRASALLDASRVFLHDTISEAYREAEREGWFSEANRLRCQLAACFAAESCAEAVDRVCRAAATSAIRIEQGLERHLRDAQTLRHHADKSYGRYEDVGKMMFGIPPTYFLLEF
jgi:alkylation response protein AidB-like acyl-CoA dehydrogenase